MINRQGRPRQLLMLLLIVGVFEQCSTKDNFGQLDLKKWRSDRGGCNGVRATLEPAFKAEVQSLKGETSNTLGEWLGRPDANVLADRNQKFYVYYFERGPQCEQAGAKSTSRSVAIRFSAIGVATEITFQNGLP